MLSKIKISKGQLIVISILTIMYALNTKIQITTPVVFIMLWIYTICFNYRQTIIDKYEQENIVKDELLKEKAIDVVKEFSEILDEWQSGKPVTKICYGLNNIHLDKLNQLRKLVYKGETHGPKSSQ